MKAVHRSILEVPAKIIKKDPLKVAAYCRVSCESDEQNSSYESQIKYYTDYIKGNSEWIFAGVYAEKESGTDFKNRHEFNRMVKDAKEGKIDLILTKSISRFGRNTLPFLQNIYELTTRGIVVYFEVENLRTDNPVMATTIATIAAVAQSESERKSDDIKWGIRRNYERGKVQLNHSQFLGYTKDKNGNLIIVEEEANVVRLIFDLYLQGHGCRKIKKHLEERGVRTVTGKSEWSTATIDRMLSNEKYAGMALLQKSFVADPLSHKQVKNNGELSMYHVANSHEVIVNIDVFNAVQMRKRGLRTKEE